MDSVPPGPGPNNYNVLSGAQQSASGPYIGPTRVDHFIAFRVDVRPGNSGSPVKHVCGEVIAILTDGDCSSENHYNFGTSVDHPELVDTMTPKVFDDGDAEPTGICADCNQNGIIDWCEVDCQLTGFNVSGCGTADDCNDNYIPDDCEPDRDCNDNEVREIYEVGSPSVPDCNHNGNPDSCDIAEGPTVERRCVDCNETACPTNAKRSNSWAPAVCRMNRASIPGSAAATSN